MAAKQPLFAKLKSGKTVTLWVSPSDTVGAVKEKICAQLGGGCPSERLVVAYAGKPLSDEHTLEFYKVGKEAIVHCTQLAAPVKSAPEVKAKGKSAASAASGSGSVSTIGTNPVVNEEELMATLYGVDVSGGVDICFAFDTTGSMSSIIGNVRQQVSNTCSRLFEEIPGLRISIMVIGDYCDQFSSYVIATADLSNNGKVISDFVRGVRGSGGGDAPEAYEWALHKARKLSWREDPSCAKALVMIGDMHPHPKYETTAYCDWHEELDALADMGVKVYGVQASSNSSATPFYARIAERTGGFYLQFSNFSLMTKMFLAMCYREAGVEKLEEYAAEIGENDDSGKVSGTESKGKSEMGVILDELRKPDQKKVETKDSKIFCAADWYTQKGGADWNTERGRLITKFIYDPKKDVFESAANRALSKPSFDGNENDMQFEYGERALTNRPVCKVNTSVPASTAAPSTSTPAKIPAKTPSRPPQRRRTGTF
eukprot:CAMPEP_0119126338 /NCGR_PEP_ID=MMETSP1310-20130426/5302_1 /TAXON_ID=464262 /ORGANISM="Genus nov. species nov., Strain RCC2339" /LENGTH=484 /DNA_ID=CAMNT_0007116491 /DNA_START=175 /DNA_END=1626 /DNA_ORIENTATION=+